MREIGRSLAAYSTAILWGDLLRVSCCDPQRQNLDYYIIRLDQRLHDEVSLWSHVPIARMHIRNPDFIEKICEEDLLSKVPGSEWLCSPILDAPTGDAPPPV